jgi:hypothetical protein
MNGRTFRKAPSIESERRRFDRQNVAWAKWVLSQPVQYSPGSVEHELARLVVARLGAPARAEETQLQMFELGK